MSRSDALPACPMAEIIGPSEEVLTTAFPFFATAGVIAPVGAVPVFLDIDPVTPNLEPSQFASETSDRGRAIMPVPLCGQVETVTAMLVAE